MDEEEQIDLEGLVDLIKKYRVMREKTNQLVAAAKEETASLRITHETLQSPDEKLYFYETLESMDLASPDKPYEKKLEELDSAISIVEEQLEKFKKEEKNLQDKIILQNEECRKNLDLYETYESELEKAKSQKDRVKRRDYRRKIDEISQQLQRDLDKIKEYELYKRDMGVFIENNELKLKVLQNIKDRI